MRNSVIEAKIQGMLRLMRPKHYIKNVLVFVSLIFDRNLLKPSVFLHTLGGFIAFSLLSSVVYIFNDIHDVEADRLHEVKRHRPIASGEVSVKEGYILALLLLLCAGLINCFSAELLWQSFALMGLYFALNLGYSMGLKEIPILDVVLLVSGFLLRVLYGSVIICSTVTSWVYLTVLSLSFYFGLGKRRNEILKIGDSESTRKVLLFYSYGFLDKFMYLCLTLAITFYSLWSADASIVEKYGTDKIVWTVPLVIIIMMKYSADIEANSYGDPVDVVLHDKALILLGILYGFVMMGLLYGPRVFV